MFDLGVAHDEMAERLLEHHLACVGWIDRDPAKRRPRHLGPAMLRAGDVAAIIGIEGAGIFYREAGPKDAPPQSCCCTGFRPRLASSTRSFRYRQHAMRLINSHPRSSGTLSLIPRTSVHLKDVLLVSAPNQPNLLGNGECEAAEA